MKNSIASIEAYLKNSESYVEPTWKRLGFPMAPDPNTSGKGIGIIILDDIIPHSSVQHLGKRLKQVKVDDDFHVSCIDVGLEEPQPMNRSVEHGMMTLQLISHLPLQVHNHLHVGLAPAATFIMLSEVDPGKIEKGLEWILQHQEEWNIQLVLNLLVPNTREIGSMKSPSKDPFVQAMNPAIQAGLFIIAANGNTKAHNNLHPIEFFTVGGYDDAGLADSIMHKSHPAVPYGRNGDGDIRPDILAPFTYLPLPYCEQNESNRLLSYFGGSCGAAALMTGVCAHILAEYPFVKHGQLRDLLINSGEFLQVGENPTPKVEVSSALQLLEEEPTSFELTSCPLPLEGKKASISLPSNEEIKRASKLTELIDSEKIERESLWSYLEDESSVVRKTVISYGLGLPSGEIERARYWEHVGQCEKGTGERISWLYQLLFSSNENELDKWVQLLKDKDLEQTLCVKIYLEQHYKDAPEITYTPDPNPELIVLVTEPVWNWYEESRRDETI